MKFLKTLAGAEALIRLCQINLSRDRRPFGCSIAPTSRCNLRCLHCYERRRADGRKKELSLEGVRELCDRLFREGVRHCTVTDGEPFLNRASMEKCEAIVDSFWATYIVTNGTREIPDLPALVIVSLDGPKRVHNRIRGEGVFEFMRRNVSRAPHDAIYALCTLNTINRAYIRETVVAAKDIGFRGIMFNWHNPLDGEDPLWVPFPQRNQDIDIILGLKDEAGEFILNTRWELDALRGSEWTSACPSSWIISFDASGRVKRPCVFQDQRMCPRCGCHVFPALEAVVKGRPSIEARLMLSFIKSWWLRKGALSRLEIPRALDDIATHLLPKIG
ncbi:MAG: radical SAM protein [Thermoplasmatota archaeon]